MHINVMCQREFHTNHEIVCVSVCNARRYRLDDDPNRNRMNGSSGKAHKVRAHGLACGIIHLTRKVDRMQRT